MKNTFSRDTGETTRGWHSFLRREWSIGKVGVRATFLLLLFFMLVVTSFFGGYVTFSLFFALLIMAALGLASIWYVNRNTNIYLKHDMKRYVSGSETQVTIAVENKGFLPIPLVALELESDLQGISQKALYEFAVAPRDMSMQTMGLRMMFRGRYRLRIARSTMRDMWDIFRRRTLVDKSMDLLVYPRLHKLESMSRSRILAEHEERFLKRGFEEGGLYSEIRDYKRGDSLSRIHWKLSATKGELKSKHFDTSDDDEIFIWLDMARPTADNFLTLEERMMELVAATAYHCLRMGLPVTLGYYQGDSLKIHEARTVGGFELLYASLAAAQFDSSVTLKDFIKQQLPVRETLVFHVGEYDDYSVLIDNPNRRVEVFALSQTPCERNVYKNSRALTVHKFGVAETVSDILSGT